jgi:hypothetical protein
VSAQESPEKRHCDFEFNLREPAGSMGDFGTLFPLAIGYIAVNGLNPAGLFIMLGLTNIAQGLIYHLPMPLQPKKVIAVAAIGFATGLAAAHLLRALKRRCALPCLCSQHKKVETARPDSTLDRVTP